MDPTRRSGRRADQRSPPRGAWDALCAKLRDVTAGAVVPRAMRTASRGSPRRPRDAGGRAGRRRRLCFRTRDPQRSPASADAVLAGVCVPLALDGHKPVADPPRPARSTSCSATPLRAGTRVRVRGVRRLLWARSRPPRARRRPGLLRAADQAHAAVVDRAYVCGVVAAPTGAGAAEQVASRAYWLEALDRVEDPEAQGHWTSAPRRAGPSLAEPRRERRRGGSRGAGRCRGKAPRPAHTKKSQAGPRWRSGR